MPHYYPEQQHPDLPASWLSMASMNATILLDQGANVSYTNLDEISGRVVVRVGRSADVSSIVCKLEGESRTRLLSPPGDDGRGTKPQLEYHKILYKVQTVFPPTNMTENIMSGGKSASYTLPSGQHEYPFKFKIPFNNTCSYVDVVPPMFDFAALSVELAKPATRHVKKTLPPTLTGFPGEAEIRYFVKATIHRSSFFRENPRTYVPFNFLPIEPPRPPWTGSEIYARQKHAFTSIEEQSAATKMKGIFGKKAAEEAAPTSNKAPFVSIDARLPDPPILTCCDDLPLRIIVKKLNDYHGIIYLQSLQVSLIGITKLKAHDSFRDETSSWVVMSKSNMGIRIGNSEDPVDRDTVIDNMLWSGQPLPNTVAPSFDTCNISRTYALDVRVGLSYGAVGARSSKAQNIALPLRLNCDIYSGIRPPPEILERIAAAKANTRRTSVPEKTAAVPPEPCGPPVIPARPAAGGSSQAASSAPPPEYSEAPPSYEDAVAQELPPIDGPRREYAPSVPTGEDPLFGRDEKRAWVS